MKINGPALLTAILAASVLALQAPNAEAQSNCSPGSGSDVKVVNAAAPDIPKADYHANVYATILVTVGPNGRVVNAKVARSSGFAAIDHAAIVAAEGSTYAPATSNCKPVTGQYLFQVRTGP
ncbi:MAG TPA: TonB family protein [Candidatus Acidoferrales bacterium]|nr:TonB family protein [Candidatus Acidoferrales bacterium]